ncbi:ATP-binding protein [Verrucomicrobiota bacterium]
MFVGRDREIDVLEGAYTSRKSELIVVYGRRRIGKSSLVARFAEDKPVALRFEGLEGEHTDAQIRHFAATLSKQTEDPLLRSVAFRNWEDVLSYLTERIIKTHTRQEKLILFFDELPWMAAGRGRLVSLLKYYWDNHWKDRPVMLILCGSVASFMVKKVLRSKALYGRITLEILLGGLAPREAVALLRNRRSAEEVFKYFLVFGGVPKYLEEIRLNRSFAANINRLCFSENSPLIREVERIFYNQFRESRTYQRIVELLRDRMLTLRELSDRMGMPSGGGLKLYISNLEQAEIIRSFVPFGKGPRAKLRKYALSDEYLHFYFKFVEPNRTTIAQSPSPGLFERLTARSFDTWLGFAFERFCVKHAARLAGIMGFQDEVLVAAPYFERGDMAFQIDLLYQRADGVITVCEAKYHHRPISTKVIPEMERKCSVLPVPRGYTREKALVSLHGPDDALRDTGYFDHYVTLSDIMGTPVNGTRRR